MREPEKSCKFLGVGVPLKTFNRKFLFISLFILIITAYPASAGTSQQCLNTVHDEYEIRGKVYDEVKIWQK